MKKILFSLLLVSTLQVAKAQESYNDHRKSLEESKKDSDPEIHGFDASRIFIGGSGSLGYGSYQDGDNNSNNTFNIGAIPDIGYSLTNFVDVGLSSSFNYSSTVYPGLDAKQIITSYSLGAFIRIYPMNNFFIQLMPEQDWGTRKQIFPGQTDIIKIKSNCFLAGIGLTQRVIGESYFYTLIMVDLGKDRFSPYNSYNSSTDQVYRIPIARVGFNFYPFRKWKI